MTFEAKYAGRCDACSNKIHVGDDVVYVDDELVHADCEGRALRGEKKVEVCTECFLEKPCGCEDGQ